MVEKLSQGKEDKLQVSTFHMLRPFLEKIGGFSLDLVLKS